MLLYSCVRVLFCMFVRELVCFFIRVFVCSIFSFFLVLVCPFVILIVYSYLLVYSFVRLLIYTFGRLLVHSLVHRFFAGWLWRPRQNSGRVNFLFIYFFFCSHESRRFLFNFRYPAGPRGVSRGLNMAELKSRRADGRKP